jgi:hypothetical protein
MNNALFLLALIPLLMLAPSLSHATNNNKHLPTADRNAAAKGNGGSTFTGNGGSAFGGNGGSEGGSSTTPDNNPPPTTTPEQQPTTEQPKTLEPQTPSANNEINNTIPLPPITPNGKPAIVLTDKPCTDYYGMAGKLNSRGGCIAQPQPENATFGGTTAKSSPGYVCTATVFFKC